VLFTRNHGGLAGALKKIGGLAEGSRIRDGHAEEISHMFFGDAFAGAFFNPFATHPPLAERIRALEPDFDGHSNCFIETGRRKAILIDFNYETEPLPGHFPFPKIGPMPLLKPSRLNHLGKLAFRWIYWNMLLKARPIPFIPSRMKMAGKIRPEGA